jgi:hypothetical protein
MLMDVVQNDDERAIEEGEVARKKRRKNKEDGEGALTIFPNNPANVKDFGWCLHGKDNVRADKRRGKKQPGEVTYVKEYYICSEKKKGGTCGAKKTVHHLPKAITPSALALIAIRHLSIPRPTSRWRRRSRTTHKWGPRRL